MSRVRIEQIDVSPYGSEVLRIASEIAGQLAGTSVQVEKAPISGQKGEEFRALEILAIGVAGRAIYDIIKASILRLINRPDRPQTLKLKINNQEVRITVINNQDIKIEEVVDNNNSRPD